MAEHKILPWNVHTGCSRVAAGNYNGSSLNNWGSNGNYWSSTPTSTYVAYDLSFDSDSVYAIYGFNRYGGFSVRLVRLAQ